MKSIALKSFLHNDLLNENPQRDEAIINFLMMLFKSERNSCLKQGETTEKLKILEIESKALNTILEKISVKSCPEEKP